MNIFYKRVKEALPVNDITGVVGKLADPWARLHRYEYSGGVGRAILRKCHVVRGMRLKTEKKRLNGRGKAIRVGDGSGMRRRSDSD